MQSVRRTFITPFDRSDIQELIQSMDDAIDQMQQTVKTIALFEVREFDPLMREMASLAVEAAYLTLKAVPLLREIVTNAGAINAYAEAVTHLEGKSDHLYDEGLRELFRRHKDRRPDGFHRRIADLRAPRKGARPLRGRRRASQRHRHRACLGEAIMTGSLAAPLLVGLIVTALAFDFLNGLHDAANSIATIVSTRVLSPRLPCSGRRSSTSSRSSCSA